MSAPGEVTMSALTESQAWRALAAHRANMQDVHMRQLFADDPKIKIVKGMLPETLLQQMPDKVAFVQVDLNAAQVELDCLQAIYDRISVGGMIVLDDYGFYRYRNSYQAQKPFFEARGAFAYECPTGQGIVIKRR